MTPFKRFLAFVTLIISLGCSPVALGTSAATIEGVARARAVIEGHRTKPVFSPPGAPFDAAKCAAGKKMLSIPHSSGIPFLKGLIEREILAGKDVGLSVQEWQNQGQPSQWVQGMEFGVHNKFKLIDLISGIDPKTLEPQVRIAAAAGVKTMVSHFYDPSQVPNPLVAASLPVSFNTVGKLLADWVIVRTNGNAKVVLVVTDEVISTAPLARGFEDELKGNCPDCKIIQRINTGAMEWGTKIRPSVQAALLAHPEVNFVVPIYDSMVQFVVPAVQITGRQSSIRIATFNGTPFVLDYIRGGKVDMDIGESLDWIARATIDGYLRADCGLPVPRNVGVPFYIFDSTNVAEAGIPAGFDKGYGDAYLKGFRTLWMLK